VIPTGWQGSLGGEGDSRVVDDLVYDGIVGDEGNGLHLGAGVEVQNFD
jgi:hypothetical protein